MAIPTYLWMYDTQGNHIKSHVTIAGREGSAEVLQLEHEIRIPSDQDTSLLTGTRKHEPIKLVKRFCQASPLLHKACCDGRLFQKVQLSWYRIDDSGKESEYFRHTFTQARIVSIQPFLYNVKDRAKEHFGHLESIGFRYQTIKWEYLDGNISAQDSWLSKD